MALSLASFLDNWTIKGGGTPVADNVSGGRSLSLIGTGTAPRASSYRRRRGAEFRSATFSATSPRAFATASPGTLHTALYVASKIQSFTVAGWVKPQKSGVSAFGLTPIGGLFSATNMGVTAWIYDQPCLVLMDGAAGSGYVVVSCFGSLLDTRYATQSSGPVTTTPLADGEYSFVAVRVTGSTSVNNRVDSVELYCRTQDGVVRTYTLGENRATATVVVGGTTPADGKIVTINGRVRTFKTTLTGSPAAGQLTYGAGNAVDGDTFVVGDDTYTLRDYVGSGLAATAALESGNTTQTNKTQVQVGGWVVTMLWGTSTAYGAAAGALATKSVSNDAENIASKQHRMWNGVWDNDVSFKIPAPPATGTYDAGRAWTNRRILTGTSLAVNSAYVASSHEIPLRALSIGTQGNAVKVAVLELDSAATPAFTLPCTPCRVGKNTTYILRIKATTTDVITAALGGAGSVANGTYKYTCTFVHASGESVEQNPTTRAVTGGPRVVDLTTIPLGPTGTTARKLYRTKAGGSVYFLLATISDNTTTTYTDTTADASLPATGLPTTMYMVGGANAAGAKSVKIGANWAATQANMVKAINATGVAGTDYSADITSANATASAAAAGNDIALTSLLIGSAGNGKPLSESCAALSGVVAFAGGGAGTNDQILIGGSVDAAWQNLADAINLTGSRGTAYGDAGTLTVDAYVTATYSGGALFLRSKEAGTTGNSRGVSTDATGATVKDQFRDKTVTTLNGGQAAPPFVVPSGARPDQSDLRFVWGGWGTT